MPALGLPPPGYALTGGSCFLVGIVSWQDTVNPTPSNGRCPRVRIVGVVLFIRGYSRLAASTSQIRQGRKRYAR